VIFTLAGHVDHGKSSLVHALTGADTDRLAEEQRRGLTIDLGFAYTEIDGHRVGFVDVPGHHRFIHNMVAGVAMGQTALLVVAADDGVMPQTREHVAILDLIGIDAVVIAVTKCDRAEPARRAEVEAGARALLAATRLEVVGCAHTALDDPASIDTLRDALATAVHIRSHDDDPADSRTTGNFRLAVDRAFDVHGVGLVATGTVHSGSIVLGSEVCIAPRGLTARLRRLRAQDREAERAIAGERCALNLSGVGTGDVRRGDWIVAPAALGVSRNVVLALAVLREFPRPVRHGLPVHVYHATSHCEARLRLLEGNVVVPGASALAELCLAERLLAKRGDRIVLRDHGLDATLGGGEVIDVTAHGRGRRSQARLARLRAHAAPTAAQALDALLDLGCVDLAAFRTSWNLDTDAMDALTGTVDCLRRVVGGRVLLEDRSRWQRWRQQLLDRVAAEHLRDPDSAGLARAALADAGLPAVWLEALLKELAAEGLLELSAGVVRRRGHRPRLTAADTDLLERIEQRLTHDAVTPSIGDLAKSLRTDLARLKGFVQRMHAQGRLVRVSESRAFLPAQMTRFVALARSLAAEHPAGFAARAFRDASGTGRNLAIEVLEHFDDRGFTRRDGDLRRIVGPDPY
jgi:selenocysteine-specific elongation factor